MAPPEVISMKPCPLVPVFKERPILFSAPMVRALLDGTKTQTRRVMARQKQHEFTDYTLFGQRGHPDDEEARRGGWARPWVAIEHAPDWPDGKEDQCECPYARERGDRLWVRETYFAWGRWETRYSAKKGRDEWHFVDMTVECGKPYLYDANQSRPQPLAGKRDGGVTPKWWKRPAIFMPRAASRIDLEINDLRIERLQEISRDDAKAEGCAHDDPCDHVRLSCAEIGCTGPDYRVGFRKLWKQINGTVSWDASPWVWAVSFKVVKP